MSLHSENSAVIQLLLGGEFICEVTHEHHYNYLSDAQNLKRVNEFLVILNRRVRQTSDRKAFLCAYADMDSAEVKHKIRGQFKEICTDLEPLVRWLSLAQACQPHRDPLRSGDLINEVDLLNAMNSSQTLCDQLDELCRRGVFSSSAAAPKDKLKQVFKQLVALGFLKNVGHSGMQYQATAKWSWLYDTMDFIRAHEDIELGQAESLDNAQSGLLL